MEIESIMATKDEKNVFSTNVIHRAERNHIKCMEALIDYCEELNLEIESAALLVNDVLKSRLEEEAQLLHFLPRSAKLPI